MSYGVGAALQVAVFERLSGDVALTDLVGDAIYDALPSGTPPDLYVSLGPEKVRDRSDKSGQGAEHEIVVSVVSAVSGFRAAKDVAAAISDAMVNAPMTLARGRLVSLGFLRAAARRTGTGDTRQIDLSFRARVEDD